MLFPVSENGENIHFFIKLVKKKLLICPEYSLCCTFPALEALGHERCVQMVLWLFISWPSFPNKTHYEIFSPFIICELSSFSRNSPGSLGHKWLDNKAVCFHEEELLQNSDGKKQKSGWINANQMVISSTKKECIILMLSITGGVLFMMCSWMQREMLLLL